MSKKLCPECIEVVDSAGDTCLKCGSTLRLIASAQSDQTAASSTHADTTQLKSEVVAIASSINTTSERQREAPHVTDDVTETSQKMLVSTTQSVNAQLNPAIGMTSTNQVVANLPGGKFVSRASEIRENSYTAAEFYIVLLTLSGIFFFLITGVLILVVIGMNGSSRGGGIVGMLGTYAAIPTTVITAILSFLSFYLRDILKMKVDDSHNIAFMSKRLDEAVQLLAQAQSKNHTDPQ